MTAFVRRDFNMSQNHFFPLHKIAQNLLSATNFWHSADIHVREQLCDLCVFDIGKRDDTNPGSHHGARSARGGGVRGKPIKYVPLHLSLF